MLRAAGDRGPVVFPVNYVLDRHTPVFRTEEGTKLHAASRCTAAARVRRALDEAKAPLLFPIQLTAQELTGLLAWPIGAPHVAGLPRSRSQHLPPSGAIPPRGLAVARANFPGAERPLALSPVDVCKHLQIVGPIGVGKTVLAGNLVRQAIEDDAGVIVMERKGDLFHMALDAVSEQRLDNVIVMDVDDVPRATPPPRKGPRLAGTAWE